jgi:hypothetical protein
MFPKLDYLFNLFLYASMAYIGLVVGNVLFRFAILLIGG